MDPEKRDIELLEAMAADGALNPERAERAKVALGWAPRPMTTGQVKCCITAELGGLCGCSGNQIATRLRLTLDERRLLERLLEATTMDRLEIEVDGQDIPILLTREEAEILVGRPQR